MIMIYNIIYMYIKQNRNRLTDTEDKLGVTGGERAGGEAR